MGGSESKDPAPKAASEPEPEPYVPPLPDFITGGAGERSELLPDAAVRTLNARISGTEWKLFFSSIHHGTSWQRMLNSICHKGTSLVVIRESPVDGAPGRVFGGFADTSWTTSTAFFGGGRCFLFALDGEDVKVFRSKDSNRLYLNSESSNYPNGLAFGGQLYDFEGNGKNFTGFFGLSLSTDMATGSSAPVATYANDSLPTQGKSDKSFGVDAVEVWGTEPDFTLSVDQQFELAKKMGRQMDAGTAFVLEAAGVAQHAKAAGIEDHK